MVCKQKEEQQDSYFQNEYEHQVCKGKLFVAIVSLNATLVKQKFLR